MFKFRSPCIPFNNNLYNASRKGYITIENISTKSMKFPFITIQYYITMMTSMIMISMSTVYTVQYATAETSKQK